MTEHPVHAPSLTSKKAVVALDPRQAPYWNILEYCRHIGVQKTGKTQPYWVARIRTTNGSYKQQRLAPLDFSGKSGIAYDEAVDFARKWFEQPEVKTVSSTSYPVGTTRVLKYQTKGGKFTVGDALTDYVEWKRISAAPSHFETNLSLINYHIIPRLGDVPLDELTGREITKFAIDVLETPPKRGNQEKRSRIKISELDSEALRKRKKTLNALIGILRLAIRMAWENGETDSERSWRCIRSVPNFDRPRSVILDRKECTTLLENCPPDLRKFVQAALYTGCRAGELANLKICDVGVQVFGIFIASGKNYRSRFVFLPDEGMAFFLELCRGRDGSDLVFRTRRGRAWKANHKGRFKSAVVASGLPKEFVFHGLRHTYASQLVQAGTPLIVVAQQLGHANTDTVSRTYGHLSPQTREYEVRHRFSTLDKYQMDLARSLKQELSAIKSSLQGDVDRQYGVIDERQSWPRSNFFKSTGPLVESLRDISANQ